MAEQACLCVSIMLLARKSFVLFSPRTSVQNASELFNFALNRKLATQQSEVAQVSLVRNDDDKRIAVLGLNHPAVKNALSKSLVGQLRSHVEQLASDASVSVLLIRSLVPGVFCAGADLRERLDMPLDQVGPFVDTLRALCMEIDALPMPTIAALDGAALGGGLELALSCDLRVATTTVKLGLVETKLAIIPGAGGTQRLPRLIGVARAKELIYTGRIIDGVQAHNLGVVNLIVEQNKTRDAAALRGLELAREIASSGPIALRAAKEAINKGVQLDMESAMDVEKSCYAQVIPTRDRTEGLRAFVEKRPPVYSGH